MSRFSRTKRRFKKFDRKAKKAFHAVEEFFKYAEAAGEITHAISGGAYGDNLRKGGATGKKYTRDAVKHYDQVHEQLLLAEAEGRAIADEIKYILDG